jgi:Flp pilus assembly pilin Flp
MLTYYVESTEALKRLPADKDGVVSLEYVIVAACICVVLIAAFGALPAELASGFAKVTAAIASAP